MRRFPQDAHAIHFFAPEHQRFIHGVLRLQNKAVIIALYTLQSRFFRIDQNGGDLAVLHFRLPADADDIAVKDASVDHAVAFAQQRKVALDIVRDGVIRFDVLVSK